MRLFRWARRRRAWRARCTVGAEIVDGFGAQGAGIELRRWERPTSLGAQMEEAVGADSGGRGLAAAAVGSGKAADGVLGGGPGHGVAPRCVGLGVRRLNTKGPLGSGPCLTLYFNCTKLDITAVTCILCRAVLWFVRVGRIFTGMGLDSFSDAPGSDAAPRRVMHALV